MCRSRQLDCRFATGAAAARNLIAERCSASCHIFSSIVRRPPCRKLTRRGFCAIPVFPDSFSIFYFLAFIFWRFLRSSSRFLRTSSSFPAFFHRCPCVYPRLSLLHSQFSHVHSFVQGPPRDRQPSESITTSLFHHRLPCMYIPRHPCMYIPLFHALPYSISVFPAIPSPSSLP